MNTVIWRQSVRVAGDNVRTKRLARRVVVYVAVVTLVLSSVALILGNLLEDKTGLAFTGWGLLLLLVPLLATILVLSQSKIARKILVALRRFFQLHRGKSSTARVLGNAAAWRTYWGENEGSYANQSKDSDEINPDAILAAHYNWDTDEFDGARGPHGLYDPPFDPTIE